MSLCLWYGAARFGLVWPGSVRYGLARCGVVWFGKEVRLFQNEVRTIYNNGIVEA